MAKQIRATILSIRPHSYKGNKAFKAVMKTGDKEIVRYIQPVFARLLRDGFGLDSIDDLVGREVVFADGK